MDLLERSAPHFPGFSVQGWFFFLQNECEMAGRTERDFLLEGRGLLSDF